MKNLPLFWKVMLPLLIAMGTIMLAGGWMALDLRTRMAEEAGLTAARSFANNIVNVRGFYTKHIVSRAKTAGMKPTHEWEQTEGGIPLPATLTRELAKMTGNDTKGAGSLRLYSNFPFKFRSGKDVELDEFEKQSLVFLQQNPKGEFFRVEKIDGKPVYRYALADVMSAPGCVACHNSHADSPKTDWKLGDVRGALEVSVPLEDMQAGVDGFILRTVLIMGSIVLAIVFVLWGVLRRTSQQVNLAADAADRIADLNLSQKVPPSESNDEAGRLLAALGNMQGHLRMMVSDISRHVTGINGSAGHLAEESARLAKTADTQAGAAGSVAQAVEEVSASMGEMKHHADGAFEISQRSGDDARASADNAHRTAVEIRSIADSIRKLAGTMGELDKASSEISTVVGVIREVADQTNLLALNAAIEAARAGEAGRGFAVVADEVRKLAERTAQSTQMITATVERIQHGTRLSVEATEHNTSAAEGCESVAHQAGESVNAICAGMEQTLHAIESIQNALSEQERAIHIVADQAEGIARVTDESSAASHRVADSSRQISQMAEELNALASRFKV